METPGPLAAPLPRPLADEVALLLASEGIDTRLVTAADGVTVLVARAALARASAIVLEEYPDGLVAAGTRRARRRPRLRPGADRWFGPASWVVLAIVAACAAVFAAEERAGGSEVRTVLLEFGASRPAHVRTGEYWRLITAMFVHIGPRHLLANAVTLLVLGPALAAALGAARFGFVYVVAGTMGNVLSYQLADPDVVSAGASGAILGVLGALGGQRLRFAASTRYHGWQVVAAVLAYLAIAVGAGPEVDTAAHLGGLAAGLGLGLVIPPPAAAPTARERGLTLACGCGAAALVAGAYLGLLLARVG
jgi:rhomboid protease GluP